MRRLALLAAVALVGCSGLGGVNDGTSLSRGQTNNGALINAARLPVRGDGYAIPPTWATRGLNWGTDELVGLIVRAARRVEAESPGAPLYVADLSPRFGGASAWHRSHQTGRDADLHFYATDDAGNAARVPSSMPRFVWTGDTPAYDERWHRLPQLHFDVARNWLLVRALVEDPAADVQYLFIYEPLKDLLMRHAVEVGEPVDLLRRADAVLRQPGDALPHDDHLHLRIYCPADDRSLGCQERGPLRWFKKSYKYLQSQGASPTSQRIAQVSSRPFCRFLASTVAVAAR
jgi:penicillin-insensitive murein DD-endopeptidase